MRRILVALAILGTACSSTTATETSAGDSSGPIEMNTVPGEADQQTRHSAGVLRCPTELVESQSAGSYVDGEISPISSDNTPQGVADWFMSSGNPDWQMRLDWQRLTPDAALSSGTTFVYSDQDDYPYLEFSAQQVSGVWVLGGLTSCAPATLDDLTVLDEDFVPIPDSSGQLPFDQPLACKGAPVSMEFLTELPIADGNFPGMISAIQPFLESEEGVLWDIVGDWRVAHADEDFHEIPQATLVAGDGINFSWMFLELVGGEWRWRGSSSGGDCELHVVLNGANTVEWDVITSSPESAVIEVSASERECVSGQAMGERLRQPVVTLTADFAYILLSADKPDGDFHNCQGNPSVELAIDLGEPLGDREVRNTQKSMGWFSEYWPVE